jgi:hypothetical protein
MTEGRCKITPEADLFTTTATLVGLPQDHLRRLQAVQNAAARLIFGLRRRDHFINALIELHWLRVPERIEYKLMTLVYRALNGSIPSYLNVFQRISDVPAAAVCAPRPHTSSSSPLSKCRLSEAAHFRSLALSAGTGYLPMLQRHPLSMSSDTD